MIITVEKGPYAHDVVDAALVFNGFALDFDENHITFAFSGSPERLDECETMMRQYGISLQVWRILASLLWRDRQRITELALNTSIEVSTVSRLVAANVRRGLLTRLPRVPRRNGELPHPPTHPPTLTHTHHNRRRPPTEGW